MPSLEESIAPMKERKLPSKMEPRAMSINIQGRVKTPPMRGKNGEHSNIPASLPPLDKIGNFISNLDEFGIGYVSRVGEVNKHFLLYAGRLLRTH